MEAVRAGVRRKEAGRLQGERMNMFSVSSHFTTRLLELMASRLNRLPTFVSFSPFSLSLKARALVGTAINEGPERKD